MAVTIDENQYLFLHIDQENIHTCEKECHETCKRCSFLLEKCKEEGLHEQYLQYRGPADAMYMLFELITLRSLVASKRINAESTDGECRLSRISDVITDIQVTTPKEARAITIAEAPWFLNFTHVGPGRNNTLDENDLLLHCHLRHTLQFPMEVIHRIHYHKQYTYNITDFKNVSPLPLCAVLFPGDVFIRCFDENYRLMPFSITFTSHFLDSGIRRNLMETDCLIVRGGYRFRGGHMFA